MAMQFKKTEIIFIFLKKITKNSLTSILLYVILILGYLAEHLLPFDKQITTNRKDTTRK